MTKHIRFSTIVGAAAFAAAALASFAQAADQKPVPADVVAVVAGQPITAAEVEQAVASKMFRLRTEEYKLRAAAIEDIVSKRLLAAEAAKRGVTVDELLRTEVEAKAEDPTPEQVHMVYEATKDRFGNVPEEAALAQIASNLHSQRASKNRSAFLASLRGNGAVRILIEPPRLAVAVGDGPTRGPAGAPVTIVEYSDFECPFCGRASATVAELLKLYPTQVRLVFHHFPLPMHRNAALAAKAAACADRQGKFWEMHDALFANQKNLLASDIAKYAGGAGLDAKLFETCLGEEATEAVLRADHDAGASYGVTGTPAFFINGRLIQGSAPKSAFTAVIDDEIARTAKTSQSKSTSEEKVASRR